jgi:hypothetical protein
MEFQGPQIAPKVEGILGFHWLITFNVNNCFIYASFLWWSCKWFLCRIKLIDWLIIYTYVYKLMINKAPNMTQIIRSSLILYKLMDFTKHLLISSGALTTQPNVWTGLLVGFYVVVVMMSVTLYIHVEFPSSFQKHANKKTAEPNQNMERKTLKDLTSQKCEL